jgi:hypothetical protein
VGWTNYQNVNELRGGTLGLTWSCFIASKMGDIAANEASDAGAL